MTGCWFIAIFVDTLSFLLCVPLNLVPLTTPQKEKNSLGLPHLILSWPLKFVLKYKWVSGRICPRRKTLWKILLYGLLRNTLEIPSCTALFISFLLYVYNGLTKKEIVHWINQVQSTNSMDYFNIVSLAWVVVCASREVWTSLSTRSDQFALLISQITYTLADKLTAKAARTDKTPQLLG